MLKKIELKVLQRIAFVIKHLQRKLKKSKTLVELQLKTKFEKLDLSLLATQTLARAVNATDIGNIIKYKSYFKLPLDSEIPSEYLQITNKKIIKDAVAEYLLDLSRVLKGHKKPVVEKQKNETVESDLQEISESEWVSDDNLSDIEPEQPAVKKKNRRGQQARRAYFILN